MICPKCRVDILLADAGFCPLCGRNLTPEKERRRKSRGNGTGCAYRDPVHRYWVAQVVDGYHELPLYDPANPENRKQRVPIRRTKSGFKRREDALAYCAELKNGPQKPAEAPSLMNVYTGRHTRTAHMRISFLAGRPMHEPYDAFRRKLLPPVFSGCGS